MMGNQKQFEFETKIELDSFTMDVSMSQMPTEHQGTRLCHLQPACKKSDAVFKDIKKIIKKISNGAPLQNFLFLGNPGTGKTRLACALAQELLYSGNISTIGYESCENLNGQVGRAIPYLNLKIQTEDDVIKGLWGDELLIIDHCDRATPPILNMIKKVHSARTANGKMTIIIGSKKTSAIQRIDNLKFAELFHQCTTLWFDWKGGCDDE